MKNKLSIPKKIETIFDILYLAIVPILGLYLILTSTDLPRLFWGMMALILVLGDAFHLIPRILVIHSKKQKSYRKALGRGKQITSITMTLFYLLLWHIGLLLYEVSMPIWTFTVTVLAVIRVVLCLLPQNKWINEKPSYEWGIYRNIPFLLQGIMVAIFFGIFSRDISALRFMWLAIFLSFAFYIPVVLYSNKYPKIGMLMLPKTCVYVWIVCMGMLL